MRALATAVAVIVVVLAASGCAGSGSSESQSTSSPMFNGPRPVPIVRTGLSAHSLSVPVGAKILAGLRRRLTLARSGLFLSPVRLSFLAVGSSNCPSVPVKLVVQSPRAIRVDLVVGSWSRTQSGLRVRVPQRPRICLDDLVISPVVIAINPKQVDVRHRLRVGLYYPKGVIRRYKRPVVLTVPPLDSTRITQEVRLARTSNRFFSIFPAVPGKRRCAIPDGAHGAKPIPGLCETSVRPAKTHEPAVIVTFTEKWRRPLCGALMVACRHPMTHHTWQVIEGEPIAKPGARLHVLATRSRGATAPQNYK